MPRHAAERTTLRARGAKQDVLLYFGLSADQGASAAPLLICVTASTNGIAVCVPSEASSITLPWLSIGIAQSTVRYRGSYSLAADKRNHPDGEQGTRPGKSAIPDDAPVWRVRMSGSFTPPRTFYDKEGNLYRLKPKPGWAFVLIDPETGRIVGYGFKPGGPPTP